MDLGKLREAEQDMTAEEFNILVEHKNGDHDEDETYDCELCRLNIKKWRDAQVAMNTPTLAEPQDPKVPETLRARTY